MYNGDQARSSHILPVKGVKNTLRNSSKRYSRHACVFLLCLQAGVMHANSKPGGPSTALNSETSS